jgi:hypothetical protein
MRLVAFSTIILADFTMMEVNPAIRVDANPTVLPGIIAKYKKCVDTSLADSTQSCNQKTVQIRKG